VETTCIQHVAVPTRSEVTGVQHRQGAQQGDQGGHEPSQAAAGLGVDARTRRGRRNFPWLRVAVFTPSGRIGTLRPHAKRAHNNWLRLAEKELSLWTNSVKSTGPVTQERQA
jgi:hypothetical protein